MKIFHRLVIGLFWITCLACLSAAQEGREIVVKVGDPTSYVPLLRTVAAPPSMPADLRGMSALEGASRFLTVEGAVMHGAQVLSATDPSTSQPTPQPTGLLAAGSVNSCGTIGHSGTYVLSQDLSSAGQCLNIQGADNVTLDCQGHSITSAQGLAALKAEGASHLTIKNCVIPGNEWPPKVLIQSNDLVMTDNTLGSVRIADSQGGVIARNHMDGTLYQWQCSDMQVTDNTMTAATNLESALIVSEYGSNNLFARNHLDGGWDGQAEDYQKVGSDDGIVIHSENGDVVASNSIKNAWDTGIETWGEINNLTITGNRIQSSQIAAIGGWWSNSWDKVNISDNKASDTPTFLMIQYFQDILHRPDSPPAKIDFKDVNISNNTLNHVRPPILGFPDTAIWINLNNWFSDGFDPPPTAGTYNGNTISGNQFNAPPPVVAFPTTDILADGGGNIYGPPPTRGRPLPHPPFPIDFSLIYKRLGRLPLRGQGQSAPLIGIPQP